jgi:hypothetical protein
MPMTSPRLAREHRTIVAMIGLFCRNQHGTNGALCPDCAEVLAYARQRIERCPHGEHKPSCGTCTIHCYEQSMRERIAVIMRWSGPRMPLYHPWMSIMHGLDRFRPGKLRKQTV